LRLLRRYAAFRAQQLRCPGGPCVSQTEQRKDVRLYYGTYDPETTAYLHQEQEWSEQNVRVINVYSGDKNYYVQDAFSKDGLQDGSTAGAIVIGQKEMFQAVSKELTAAGVTEDRILTNF
jgi:ferredoxin-NADP reductase